MYSKYCPKIGYLTFHVRHISTAVVIGDAEHINRMCLEKQIRAAAPHPGDCSAFPPMPAATM